MLPKQFEPIKLLPGTNGVGSGVTLKMITTLSTISASSSQENILKSASTGSLDQTVSDRQSPTKDSPVPNPKVRNDQFDFILLYSNLRDVRERWHNQESRLRTNGLIRNLLPPIPVQGEDSSSNQLVNTKPEMIGTIKDLMKTLDGFIYIMDASDQVNQISICKTEVHAFINEMVIQDHEAGRKSSRPLLIMSLIKNESEVKRTVTPFQMAKLLELEKLESTNWYIYNCSVDDLNTVCPGFVWLIEKFYELTYPY